MEIKFTIKNQNILEAEQDVLLLKYAQDFYGVDRKIMELLDKEGYEVGQIICPPDGFRLIENPISDLSYKYLLFLGVSDLRSFNYKRIRKFARKALTSLAAELPNVESIACTIHGPGYGLDEIEAFNSQIAGFVDALRSKDCPKNLEELFFYELNRGRSNRLEKALNSIFKDEKVQITNDRIVYESEHEDETEEILRSVGYESDSKPVAFVAMPFSKDKNDVYHYGIQNAVKRAGFLCERIDEVPFTGSIVKNIKKKIKKANFVVADLSNANPNVYLEVGFAWGLDKPTIFVIDDIDSLKFDVNSQRCLTYDSIKELEETLFKEIDSMKDRFT